MFALRIPIKNIVNSIATRSDQPKPLGGGRLKQPTYSKKRSGLVIIHFVFISGCDSKSQESLYF